MTTVDAFAASIPFLAVVLVLSPPGWWCLRLASRPPQPAFSTQVKHPPTVGRDHAYLGKWFGRAGLVGIVLIALVVVIATKKHAFRSSRWGPHGCLAAAGADRHPLGLRGALGGHESRSTALPSLSSVGLGDCPSGCSPRCFVLGRQSLRPAVCIRFWAVAGLTA